MNLNVRLSKFALGLLNSYTLKYFDINKNRNDKKIERNKWVLLNPNDSVYNKCKSWEHSESHKKFGNSLGLFEILIYF